MVVSLVTLNDGEATVPNCTEVAPVRFAPSMVTVVPPVARPRVGLTELTTGSAGSISIRVWETVFSYSPTAVQTDAEVHETPGTSLVCVVLVSGLDARDHVVPLSCSM